MLDMNRFLFNELIARLYFDGVQSFVKIPWKAVVKVGLIDGDEWQVVAEPRLASKGWQ